MKPRILIISGIAALIGITIILGANMMMESAKQREIELNQSHLVWDVIPNPVCFTVDRATSGQADGAIEMGACYPLSNFESMGCTKSMLDHLYEYSNVLSPEYNGAIYLDFIGLPDGMSQEKFDECFENLNEFRMSLHSESLSEPEIMPRYEKYLDENNELNFALPYDKNGIIIDDLQRIYDWCDYSGEKPAHWYFDWSNQTHHIDSEQCKWHGCDDDQVYFRGVCMTPEAKEKA